MDEYDQLIEALALISLVCDKLAKKVIWLKKMEKEEKTNG